MDQTESAEEDGVFTTISLANDSVDSGSTVCDSKLDCEQVMMNADMEELSARVDAVKEENLKLKSENQVLGQYIENLMSASSVFQTTDTKSKRK
ncbi:short coiled-coil protein B isoform X5 [Carcharodon carcharias]|uniref:short coiled-coil protein B isoform X5 n=2 Tax=Carcharodon carcharias TaxID=13397 RepID=UPI001B7DC3ED|nr:short coiled-coil protein B isoform X5 [Carcharodon carcharias]